MSEKIAGQVSFLVASLCTGMLAMASYEVLRLLRWLLYHSKFAVWVEDLLFGLLLSVPVFYVFYQYNDGALRWYGILMLVLGALAYEKGIGRPVRSLLTRLFGAHMPSLTSILAKCNFFLHFRKK